MIKVLSSAAMRGADEETIGTLGLPGAVLMENAAMRAVEFILSRCEKAKKIAIVAGPGNNGGDGLVMARLLAGADRKVSLWSSVSQGSYRGDAAINERFLKKIGFPVERISTMQELPLFRQALADAELIVDALLGTGLDREVQGLPAALITAINEAGRPVLAVDIPSGVSADSGAIMGLAVQASWTVTFAFPKQGLLLPPGASLAGEVLIGDIGIPSFLAAKSSVNLVTSRYVCEVLPRRSLHGHKGDAGRVLIVAGGPGMTGAALLTAEAALRGGAGLVYLAAPASLCPLLAGVTREVISLALPEVRPGLLDMAAAEVIAEKAAKCDAVALGPGLLPHKPVPKLLERLILLLQQPLVLDAGALTALKECLPFPACQKAIPVLTPHPGEMSLLTGLPPEKVQAARLTTAGEAARSWQAVVLLKGANSIIATPSGDTFINPTGGPVLSTAGSGDVLTGLVVSFLAQGLDAVESSNAAAFVHGLAGDLLRGGRGYTAGDVVKVLPEVFRFLDQESASRPSPYLEPLRPCFRRIHAEYIS